MFVSHNIVARLHNAYTTLTTLTATSNFTHIPPAGAMLIPTNRETDANCLIPSSLNDSALMDIKCRQLQQNIHTYPCTVPDNFP